MRFIELAESRTINPVDVLDDAGHINEFLKKEADFAYSKYEQGIEIFRGMRGRPGLLYYGHSGTDRVSANTLNYYTLILDFLPSWKNIPKRSKSFICSTNANTAEGFGFGSTYIVFPDTDVKLAFGTRADFWGNFSKTLQRHSDRPYTINLSTFNNFLKVFITVPNTPEEMRKIILDFDTTTFLASKNQYDDYDRYAYAFVKSLIEKHGSLMKGIEYIFDPTINNITVQNFSEINTLPHDTECWFEGAAYFIKDGKGLLK